MPTTQNAPNYTSQATHCNFEEDVTMTPFTVAIDSLVDPTESYERASDSIHSPPPQKLDIELCMLYARSDSTCDYNDSLPNSPQTIYSSPSSLAVSSIQHIATYPHVFTHKAFSLSYHEKRVIEINLTS
eukprot:954104_1